MEKISNFLSLYFSAQTPLQAFLETLVFAIGVYGLLKLCLFILRYYIIYTLAKKLSKMWKGIKFKNNPYTPPPSNREDERLRDEEQERINEIKGEKVRVEKMEAEKTENAANARFAEGDFKIFLPNAVGKWQKFILGQRQNMIIAVAKKMQENKTTHFWQNFIQVQKEQDIQRRGR